MSCLVPLLAASLVCFATIAQAEVRVARQHSIGDLQFIVIEHEKRIQKHASVLGTPEVKVSTSASTVRRR